MMIVLAGMISAGKSSISKILGEHYGTEVYYEKVEGNKILPLFYTMSEEELAKKRIPFLLQLDFLDSRYKDIKKALTHDNNVLDRSIYEDWYFAKVNRDLGRISDLEFEIYENLLNNMLEELDCLPKKAPDLLVYLKCSFETILERMKKRGRAYELDPNLVDYYRVLWSGYDEWVEKHYKASQIVVINMDKIDVTNNPKDVERVCQIVDKALKKVRG